MEIDYIASVFFAWIATSSMIRFIGCFYVSRTMKVYSGFNYWTTASFLNMVSLTLFAVSAHMAFPFYYFGFVLSLFSVLLLPYGLKISGGVNSGALFPLFTTVWILSIIALITLLPFSLYENFSLTVFLVISPVFILSIYYLYRKDSLHFGLKKRLITTTLVLGILFSMVRGVMTIYDLYNVPEGVAVFRKQWVTILLDNNFTLIYFGFVLLNFRKMQRELETSTEECEVLEGLLPICAECKKIRDDSGEWNKLEGYITSHSDARFSHSICPSCIEKLYPEMKDALKDE